MTLSKLNNVNNNIKRFNVNVNIVYRRSIYVHHGKMSSSIFFSIRRHSILLYSHGGSTWQENTTF